ncbi:MAG: DMT family transporter [Oscillospiraceae bacterium]|nr:DMT family transporter [Oscillospiraceae bacterium]
MKFSIRQNVLPLVAAFIWGTAFVAQSLGADAMSAFAFNAVRNIIASIFLLVLVFVFDKIHKRGGREGYEKYLSSFAIPEGMSFDEFEKYQNRGLAKGGILCGIALTVAMNLQQAGLADTGAGKAGFITALYVVLVPVFGLFIGKKVPTLIWFSVILSVVGLYLLCVKEGFTIAYSDLILLACAVAFTFQMLLVDHFATYVDGVKLSLVQFTVVAVLSSIIMLVTEGMPSLETIKLALIPLLYTGIMSSGVAYTLQIISQKDANPTVVSLLMCMESVFATLSGAVLLHEKMITREYLGCIIMFSAVILSQIPTPKFLEVKKDQTIEN